jgi:MOSC domain-containing protein YiiM
MIAGVILQVSVSRGGIPKRAIPVADVGVGGLAGDAWDHPDIHGGIKQAILLITAEGIEELVSLGFELYPGALGENLTTQGLDRRAVRIGQRYRTGSLTLEVTKLRQPCSTLDVYGPGIQAAMFDARVRAGDAASPRWGLGGFYASVVEPGSVRAGDAISLLE